MSKLPNIEPTATKPFRGALLLADPFLPDPNFSRTVVLLTESGENGAIGFVLNRPSGEDLNDLLNIELPFTVPVFIGGPVEENTLHAVHRIKQDVPGSVEISDGIYWGGELEDLIDCMQSGLADESDVRFFLGYSGWDKEQLVSELKEQSWFLTKSEPSYVFSDDKRLLWKQIMVDMGSDFAVLANAPRHPSLN